MLQTVAVMGPARVNAPLTQALTAPLLGRAAPARHARAGCRSPPASRSASTHYVVLTAALVWIVLGGLDAYAGSYDTLTGWLGILPEGERGALIVTAVVNVALAIFYSVDPGARVPLGAERLAGRTSEAAHARRGRPRARTAARRASTRARSRSPPRSRSGCC